MRPELRAIVIIANKGAGSYSQQKFDRYCSELERAGFALQRCFCSDFDEMTGRAGEISKSADNPVVVAAGGDGTINAVLNGLAGNKATCAILPMGTANVMALELGISCPSMASAAIIAGRPRPFTAGLLQSSTRSSRFFLMAGAGFDGHVVRGVSLREKQLLGKGAYLLAALRSLVSWDTNILTVTTETEKFDCASLIVCNAARYGGSFSLAPKASIFSPSLEIVAIKGSSRSHAIRAISAAFSGRQHSGNLLRTTASRITIAGLKPVQADGDDWGDTPMEILAEPDYAKILL